MRVGEAGKPADGVFRHMPVARNIVARHDGEGRNALLSAKLQAGNDEAENGPRIGGIGSIGCNRGMSRIEVAIRIDEIAAFRDRHRDDSDFRIGERFDYRRGLADRQDINHRRRDTCGRPVVVLLHDGRQEILGGEFLTHRLVGRQDARTDDPPVMVESFVEQVVQVDGLVRAVKIADAEMQYARDEALRIIVWHGGRLGQIRQVGAREFDRHGLRSSKGPGH